MTDYPILIYTDGASSGNPGPGGWGAIVATPDGHVVELGGAENPTTNNQMELEAPIAALARIASMSGRVVLSTDSSYVIQGITKWIHGWRRKGWKTAAGEPVKNRDRWQRLARVAEARAEPIEWRHVRGHAGVPGNERCDRIAVEMGKGKPVDLYSGPVLGYDIAIHDAPEPDAGGPEKARKKKSRSSGSGKAHSYLSVVGGEVRRHQTWSDCEARVKGVSGARFKKAMTAGEEGEILAAWGLSGASIADG